MNSNKRVHDALLETGLPVAHIAFRPDDDEDAPAPPFLVFMRSDTKRFHADGDTYATVDEYEVELYESATSRATEKKVEDVLKSHFGFFGTSGEIYIEEEDLVETVYTIRFLSDLE